MQFSSAEHFAQELYKIHVLTEKYLEHKAKDGVNKNAYQKLCAVEETSKLIEEAFEFTGEQRLPDNMRRNRQNGLSLPPTTNVMKVNLKQRLNAVMRDGVKDQIPALSDQNCSDIVDNYVRQNKKAAAVGKDKIERVVRDVDNCMCKIMLKAVDKAPENVDKSAVRALKGMRSYFHKNPFPKVEKELDQAVRNEDPMVHGPVH